MPPPDGGPGLTMKPYVPSGRVLSVCSGFHIYIYIYI